MRKVYLLGAGASRELKFSIRTVDAGYGTNNTNKFLMKGPLSSGYFYDANNIAQAIKDRLPIAVPLEIPDNLSQYICEYYNKKFGRTISKEDILNNKKISGQINIETLYRDIDKEIADLDRKENEIQNQQFNVNDSFRKLSSVISVKNDLLKYIYRSLSLICNYTFSIYHTILASYIITYGGDVISFNWDILLDEAMQYTDKWSYVDGYGIKFEDIIYKNERNQNTFLRNNSDNIILKPHGSMNWYKKTNGSDDLYLVVPIKRNLRSGTLDILNVYESDKNKKRYFTSIVPPGMKRKAFTAFPGVWLKMKEVLEKADEIIAIGFSFNDNDGHVTEEFESINFSKDLRVSLINPKANRTLSLYKDVFKTNNIVNTYTTLGNYCNGLSNRSG